MGRKPDGVSGYKEASCWFIRLGRRIPKRLKQLSFPVKILFLLLFGYCFSGDALSAAEVTLVWEPSPEEQVAAYRVYCGTKSGNYTTYVQTGEVFSATIHDLEEGGVYYFAATALTSDGEESAFSNEVEYTVPIAPRALEILTVSSSAVRLIGHVDPLGIYDVLASEDLKTWVPVGAVKASEDGQLEWEHLNPPGQCCFYRIAKPPVSRDPQTKSMSPGPRD